VSCGAAAVLSAALFLGSFGSRTAAGAAALLAPVAGSGGAEASSIVANGVPSSRAAPEGRLRWEAEGWFGTADGSDATLGTADLGAGTSDFAGRANRPDSPLQSPRQRVAPQKVESFQLYKKAGRGFGLAPRACARQEMPAGRPYMPCCAGRAWDIFGHI
jgi:hypothetical protein